MTRPTRWMGFTLGAIALGCHASPSAPASDIDHVRIVVHLNSPILPPGDSASSRLYAITKTGDSTSAVGAWFSSNPSVATVNGAGTIRALSRGFTTITARLNGEEDKWDSVTVRIRGSLHGGYFGQFVTLATADQPHLIVGPWGADSMIVEPGDTIYFEAGSLLDVGYLVIPPGNDSVLFTGAQPVKGLWAGIRLGAHRSELRRARIEYCGGTLIGQPEPCLASNTGPDSQPNLLLDGVTITKSAGDGLAIGSTTRLDPASRNLTVSLSDGRPVILPGQMETILPPGLQITGNRIDGIWLDEAVIADTTTWVDYGLPLYSDGVGVGGPNAPVLTIPAGMTIFVQHDGGIGAGFSGPGQLVIGSAGGPPVSIQAGVNGWTGVALGGTMGSVLRHVTLDGCGDFAPCLLVNGGGPGPLLQDVTITGSRSIGLQLGPGGSLDPRSSNLTITGSADVAVELSADQVPTLPAGVYAPNDTEGIRVRIGSVTRSATWRNLGVPYLLTDYLSVGSPDSLITLTLDSGVTVVMGVQMAVFLNGAIRALGTATAPVVFASATPGVPGSWIGIDVGLSADTSTRFDHVEIRDAGAGDPNLAGALRLDYDPGGILLHSTIVRSATCGIVIFYGNTFKQDYTAPAYGNSFVSNADSAVCSVP